jgi:hypothetical protein
MASVSVYQTINKRLKPVISSNGHAIWPLYVTVISGQRNTKFKSYLEFLFTFQLKSLQNTTLLDAESFYRGKTRNSNRRLLLDTTEIDKSKVLHSVDKEIVRIAEGSKHDTIEVIDEYHQLIRWIDKKLVDIKKS